jgi:hypothetical protein
VAALHALGLVLLASRQVVALRCVACAIVTMESMSDRLLGTSTVLLQARPPASCVPVGGWVLCLCSLHVCLCQLSTRPGSFHPCRVICVCVLWCAGSTTLFRQSLLALAATLAVAEMPASLFRDRIGVTCCLAVEPRVSVVSRAPVSVRWQRRLPHKQRVDWCEPCRQRGLCCVRLWACSLSTPDFSLLHLFLWLAAFGPACFCSMTRLVGCEASVRVIQAPVRLSGVT